MALAWGRGAEGGRHADAASAGAARAELEKKVLLHPKVGDSRSGATPSGGLAGWDVGTKGLEDEDKSVAMPWVNRPKGVTKV